MFWCNTSNLPHNLAGNVFKFVDPFEQKLSLTTQKENVRLGILIKEDTLNCSHYKRPIVPVFVLHVLATFRHVCLPTSWTHILVHV